MNFKFSILILSFLFMSFKAPKETSNKDLRTFEVVISIKEVGQRSFSLKKTASGQFFLVRGIKEKQEMFKLSAGKAKLIDEAFVDSFIKVKYMMTEFSGKKCDLQFDLEMRGEKAVVCKNESDKENQSIKIIKLFEKII